MSGPFKLKYKNSAFPFKTGEYKLKTPEASKLSVKKNISLFSEKKTSKNLSEVLPSGARGSISATFKPTKKLTLKSGFSGSLSKGNKTTYGGNISLQKKFKKGGFNIGVSKSKGDKPTFTIGGHINI
jgi:hypothetical protein